ncbi:MAG: hypothetical protein R3F20_12165 [Planctomycetota bacterium]
MPDDLGIVVVDAPVTNVGLVAAEARREAGGTLRVFAAIAGSADAPREVSVTLRRLDAGTDAPADPPLRTLALRLDEGGRAGLEVDLPAFPAGARLELRILGTDDVAADDRVVLGPDPRRLRVAAEPAEDLLADAMAALGAEIVEVADGADAAGSCDLRIGRASDGVGAAIRLPASASDPRFETGSVAGALVPVDPALAALSAEALVPRRARPLALVAGDRVLARVLDRPVLVRRGAVVLSGVDPAAEGWSERPAVLALAEGMLRALDLAPEREAALWRPTGTGADAPPLDAGETRALAAAAEAAQPFGPARARRARPLHPWCVAVALLALAALAWRRRRAAGD